MAEFASPSVITTERDFTATVQMLGTATGGTVINARWGAINEEIVCGNEDQLVAQAGKPTDSNYRDWFAAANFLKYTSSLRWVRAVDEETALNAAVGTAGILIRNKTDIDIVTNGSALTQTFAAKYAGDLGDTLAISIADSTTFATWKYNNLFDTAPDSSGSLSGSEEEALDEIHVVVVDRLGLFTGFPNTVLETYAYLSKAADAKGVNGDSIYYVNALNKRSDYVWALTPLSGTAVVEDATSKFSVIGKRLTDGKPFIALSAVFDGVFSGGADGDTPTKDEYLNAFDVLVTPPDTDVSLLFAGGCGNDLNQILVSSYVLSKTSERADMLGFVSVKYSDVVGVNNKETALTNIRATKQALTTKDSYGTISTGYKLQYDRYNDKNRWVPANGDDAGLCARTENNQDVWVSPAGFNRGHYVECIALAYNPDKNARDILYKDNINCVVSFPRDGTLLFGDKTLQPKNSTFSYIGTRRLFNYLKRSISEAAKYNLFDYNTPYTRQGFKDLIEPILREIKAREGVVDYFVRCDEKNNTSAVIEKGEFLADIIIKPQYSIQGIRLSFTAIRRDVSFDEVIVA